MLAATCTRAQVESGGGKHGRQRVAAQTLLCPAEACSEKDVVSFLS